MFIGGVPNVLLDITNLRAGYGKFEVLRGVSLEVSHGEAVCLIGPNGAGKSTVLKSVMNLTTRTRGEIFFKERNITKLPTHALLEEGLSFVPQGRLVFPSLTVEENLEMGGYLIDYRETLMKNMENVFSIFPVLKYVSRGYLLASGEVRFAGSSGELSSPKLLHGAFLL